MKFPKIGINKDKQKTVATVKPQRTAIIRYLVAGFLWFFLIGCFFVSVRTMILVADAVDYMDKKAITPKEAEYQRLAEEVAKSFAVEWLTFDSTNSDDYEYRLSKFSTNTGYDFSIPKGIQKCNSVSVMSLEKEKQRNNFLYRVNILAHVERAIEKDASEVSGVAKHRIIGTSTSYDGKKNTVSYWDDDIIYAQISVQIDDNGNPEIIGFPVLMPSPKIKTAKVTDYLDKDDVPDDFEVFVEQALTMYYNGDDLNNFITTEAKNKILPFGGYTLQRVSIESFEQDGNEAKAVVKATVATKGIESMTQMLVIDAVKKDKWFLERIGSW